MDSAHRAKEALEAKKLPEAINLYTIAIADSPTSPVYYIGRSTAYQRSHQNEKALEDAEKAVVFARQRAKRELIAQAQLRRAIALFSLQQYGNAAACLEWSKKLNEKEKSVAIWEIKANTQLKALPADDEKARVTVVEVPEVDTSTPKAAPKADGVANGAPNAEAAVSSSQPTPTVEPVPTPTQTPKDKIRHDWYQSRDTVTFTLMAKGVPKDEASIEIESKSLSISFPLTTGSSYDFSIDPLYAPVDPAASTFKVLSTKVEVIFKKAEPGLTWKSLEGTSTTTSNPATSTSADPVKSAILAEAASKTSGPSYPTSSRTGPKDWDKIASGFSRSNKKKAAKSEEDDEPTADKEGEDGYESGDDDPDFFFKKLYAGAPDDVRRAMMKSYQESGGTALSTNWEEVSKARVPIEPPDGMEAHEYEGSRSKAGKA